jgi:hypothetical protein
VPKTIPGRSPITEADAFFAGEDQSLRFTIYDDAQAAVNITGWTISWQLATAAAPGTAVVTKAATLTNPATGVCTVALAPADTTGLAAGNYVYTLRRTDTGYTQVLAWGPVVLQVGP